MAFKIKNPYYQTPDQITAQTMTATLLQVMKDNAVAIGPIAGFAEIKALLLPADKVNFTKPVFMEFARINNIPVEELD